MDGLLTPIALPDVTARREVYASLLGRFAVVPYRAGDQWKFARGIVVVEDRAVAIVTTDRCKLLLPLSICGRPLEEWDEDAVVITDARK